jgi:hypothetical protein
MKTLLTSILALLSAFSYAQGISIKLIGPKEIKESYSATNTGTTLHQISVEVTRTGNVVPTFNIPVNVTANHINTSASDFNLLTTTFTVTSAEFNASNSFKKNIHIEVQNDNESTDSGNEVFSLNLSANTAGVTAPFVNAAGTPQVSVGPSINITIVDAPKDSLKFDPFRITIGANFDFEKTVSASLFFDAQMYQPNMKILKADKKFGIGFYGSLYSNKYLTQDSLQLYNRDYQEVIGTGDTVDLVNYNYQLGVSNSIKNIGAEGGILWGWETKINSDVYLANTFILPELSAIRRSITSTYTYKKIDVDTLFNIPRPDTITRLIEQDFVNRVQNEVLFGVGYIGRFHSKKYGEFMFKFTSGAAFQKSSLVQSVRPYYAFRFQLIDPNAGVNLGGEVRGYYGSPSPYFGVYLSKSFGLKKLTDY